MSLNPRRFFGALLAGAVFVASQAFIVSSPAPAGASCAALRQWAQPYAQQRVTLDQLASFDRAHRIAVFNAVSPAVRAELWSEQLRRFAEQPGLSAEQRALVGEAARMATPAFYAEDATARRDAVRRLWEKAEPLFTTPELRRPWFELAGVVRPAPRANAQLPFCECSAGYGWMECYPGGCVSSPCAGWQGCGPIGGDACIAMCTS
jgi:hypothetical protein